MVSFISNLKSAFGRSDDQSRSKSATEQNDQRSDELADEIDGTNANGAGTVAGGAAATLAVLSGLLKPSDAAANTITSEQPNSSPANVDTAESGLQDSDPVLVIDDGRQGSDTDIPVAQNTPSVSADFAAPQAPADLKPSLTKPASKAPEYEAQDRADAAVPASAAPQAASTHKSSDTAQDLTDANPDTAPADTPQIESTPPGQPNITVSLSVTEAADPAAVVGTIATADVGTTFHIVSLEGAIIDHPVFQINGTNIELKPGVTLDFEQISEFDLNIVARNTDGQSAPTQITLTISDEAEAIQLENGGVTFTDIGVAEMSVTGGTGDDTMTGSAGDDVLAGAAGNDALDGGAGADMAVFTGNWADYTISHSGDVTTITDNRAGSPDGTDTLTGIETLRFADGDLAIADALNDAPDISATAGTVAENTAGATVGTVTGTDADAGDTLTYTVDDVRFEIVDGDLKLRDDAALDFEADGGTLDVIVTATDAHGASDSQTITLTVGDEAEAIQLGDGGATFTDTGVTETSVTGGDGDDNITGSAGDDTLVGAAGADTLTGGDGSDTAIWDGDFADFAVSYDGDTDTFTIIEQNAGDADEGRDTVIGVETFTFNGISYTAIEMQTEAARQANTGPGAASVASGGSIAENGAAGTVVATLTATDVDGDALSYAITDAAGGPVSDSNFEIVGNEIWVKSGADIDFETAESHDLYVTVSDDFETSAPQQITVTVDDEAEAIQLGDGGVSFTDTGVTETSVTGGTGGDSITGGDGDDLINGGDGDDVIDGGDGNDHIFFGNGNDVVFGGDGNDIIDDDPNGPAATGTNTLYGGAGNDKIFAGNNDSTLKGGTGNDYLRGEGGTDTAVWDGDLSNFDVSYDPNSGFFTITDQNAGGGDEGQDVVSLVEVFTFNGVSYTAAEMQTEAARQANTAPEAPTVASGGNIAENSAAGTVVATLAATDADGDALSYQITDANGDPISDNNFEIVGNEIQVKLGADIDFETATAHDLYVTASDAFETSAPQPVSVTVSDIAETISVSGTFSDAGVGESSITGSAGADVITGHDDGAVIDGAAGDDTVTGSAGDDTLRGGSGDDTVSGGAGFDTVLLSGDETEYTYGFDETTNEVLVTDVNLADGDDGTDRLSDVEFINYDIAAVQMQDVFIGTSGNDTLDLNSRDTLNTSNRSTWNQAFGGAGDDQIIGSSVWDNIIGGSGDDVIDGNLGSDTANWTGDLSDFAISYDDGSQVFTITDLNAADGDEGTDTVTDVEMFTFNGTTYTKSNLITEAAQQANTAPNSPSVASGGSVVENSADGTVVATLTATDVDGDTLRYTITDAAGNAVSDSNFEIVGNEIRVKSGADLDFEIAESHDLYVTASDDFETSAPTQITLTVSDEAEAIQLADGGVTFTDTGVTETSVTGGDGDDNITGSAGDDTLVGAAGADTLTGGDGHDELSGWSGHDTLIGGAGDDTLRGASNEDVLQGDSGNDILDGGTGDDMLIGGADDDWLTGGTHDDILDGGAGNDTAAWAGDFADFAVSYDSDTDTFTITDENAGDADEGTDTVTGVETFSFNGVDYSAGDLQTEAARQANTGPGAASVASGGSIAENGAEGTVVATLTATDVDGDTLSYTITDAAGGPVSNSNFEIVGNEIRVKPGADIDFEAVDSHDLYVTASDDFETSAPQRITLTVGDEAEAIQLGDGGATFTDTGVTETSVTGGDGDDNIFGSAGDDVLKGGNGRDNIQGGAGDDTIWDGRHGDIIDGGEGSDTILLDDLDSGQTNIITDSGTSGTDRILLSTGSGGYLIQGDFSASSGIEIIDGTGSASDRLSTGDSNANFDFTDVTLVNVHEIRGTNADDSIVGSAANDTITMKAGNDTVAGGAGDDAIDGGTGEDTISGGVGNDYLDGGDGSDAFQVAAMEGYDTIVGGSAGGWTDVIDLQGMGSDVLISGGTVDGDGWTMILDGGSAVTGQSGDTLDLSADAAGVITFDDGGTVDFAGIERITW